MNLTPQMVADTQNTYPLWENRAGEEQKTMGEWLNEETNSKDYVTKKEEEEREDEVEAVQQLFEGEGCYKLVNYDTSHGIGLIDHRYHESEDYANKKDEAMFQRGVSSPQEAPGM